MLRDIIDKKALYESCMSQVKDRVDNSVQLCRDLVEKVVKLVMKKEVLFVHRGVTRRFSFAWFDHGHVVALVANDNKLEMSVVFEYGSVAWMVRYMWSGREFYPVGALYVSAGIAN